MVAPLFPLQYLIAALALWLNRQQQDLIDYLNEENRLLKAKLGGRKIQFTDAERCRLSIRAKALGRKLLSRIDTLVTPDKLLRRHRQLVASDFFSVEVWRLGGLTTYQDVRQLLEQSGTAIIRLPSPSPNLNAYAERFVRSIKEECVQRLIFFGEASLRRALSEYLTYYHQERNHQGMNNRFLKSAANSDSYSTGVACKRARLGGILNYYYRKAA